MTTTRTLTANSPGPIVADLTLVAGRIDVIAEAREYAEVTVTTADDEGQSADAVRQATLTPAPGDPPGIVAHVRGSTIVTTQVTWISGSGNVFQSTGGTFIGGNNLGDIIGGLVAGAHAAAGSVNIGGSPITITARLPLGSSLAATTTSANVHATGPLNQAKVTTVSGTVDLDTVTEPAVETVSGTVTIRGLVGDCDVETTSGHIRVAVAADGVLVRARSISGGITVNGAQATVSARSVSGNVEIG